MMYDPEFYEHISIHDMGQGSMIFRREWQRFLTKIPSTSHIYDITPEDVATRICDILPLLDKVVLYIICKGMKRSIMLFPLIQKDYPQVSKADYVAAYNNLFKHHRIVSCIPSRTSDEDIIIPYGEEVVQALLRQLKPIVDRTRGSYEKLYLESL